MRVQTLPLLLAGICLTGTIATTLPQAALAQRGHGGPGWHGGGRHIEHRDWGRGRPGWRGGGGYHRGPGVGAVVGAGIAGLAVGALVGGALSSQAAPPPAAYSPQAEPPPPPPAYYPQTSYGPSPY
ncbi:conserved hypothetical protein [Gluconacetobacter diazotrophicus PA1 5]|uniref:Uncharacterized protein n=2 Tax=Gluconacetobacter diazotrophicus TaxID=33996 RepID=A0A7W4FDA5_GLUDI|nr:hypothetical protein [Gluconacetobacter diazotrophicus]ACI51873.1 conserved hypothetical protein [Gluconacetobacter diazotrophicus PA1 5]MBB2155572.1 hypothetical protein [Gluconacetobacter diazotrophicus]TWB11218.1 hypothetical protein FBZ86_101245 [Gluconacetobacter diazotrophicus]CAP55354.1 putative membrane protein [Gluconacetobacter diazotrophicus PA1 5]